ncbi:hypothetical protein GCM10023189_06390 [Nibrella saemangeumensis]|uniref:Mannan endo-1,4-beta-mannosidase n=1 Tax=Nibrella saemangeumensis TaxID=1084526 RepID=A0ABP8MF78_9BACT
MKAASLQTYTSQLPLPWVETTPDCSFFFTADGKPWTPIGQNDAITWPELAGLFQRKDVQTAETYLAYLAEHGVTCLRLMLEYSQTRHRYIERPAGQFPPNMVRLWDDLFALCETYRLRILLTPFDTFWMRIHWKHHPYNQANGGPCSNRSRWLLCPDTLNAIKGRFTFAIQRWGGSGVLFAWDLWNELHPAHANYNIGVFGDFISEISDHVRTLEISLYGRAHPQTVSVFGPELDKHPAMADVIFRHPKLNFASTHFYDTRTINNPKDTIKSAIRTGELMRDALRHITDNRPFFDSEHGPIHAFKDRHITYPEPFDDEYFRHIQWAHFASGGAGGGMRWPYRHPHSLTRGMRAAQRSLANFLALVQWQNFRRINLNEEVQISSPSFAVFACGDHRQAIVWLLRKDRKDRSGLVSKMAKSLPVSLSVPNLAMGHYSVTLWDTVAGAVREVLTVEHTGGAHLLINLPPVASDVALVVRNVYG